jgi:hypothetical protein
VARIVVINIVTGEAKVAMTVPRTNALKQISLTARENGTTILLGQVARSSRWVAFSFTLNPVNEIEWRGFTSGTGEVLDDPLNATDGLKIFVRTDHQQDIVTVDDASFQPFSRGCSEM